VTFFVIRLATISTGRKRRSSLKLSLMREGSEAIATRLVAIVFKVLSGEY